MPAWCPSARSLRVCSDVSDPRGQRTSHGRIETVCPHRTGVTPQIVAERLEHQDFVLAVAAAGKSLAKARRMTHASFQVILAIRHEPVTVLHC